MPRRMSVDQAKKLLERKPSVKATSIGVIMGILLGLAAQFILKPFQVREEPPGFFAVYMGNQLLGVMKIFDYFLTTAAVIGILLLIYWIITMQVIGLRGKTYDEVPHGVKKEDLDDFVDQIDESLEKAKRYGYGLVKYTIEEDGTYPRGIRLSGMKEDSISIRIRPLIAVVESDKDSSSLEAARRTIEIISASPSARTQYGHLTVRYFTRGASPDNPFGERILVNEKTRKAFWMNSVLDALARQGLIEWYSQPGENYRDWARKQNLELFERSPAEEELSP